MAEKSEWVNHSKAIMLAELGQKEYDLRLKKQEKMFEEGCKKGTIFSDLQIGMHTTEFKMLFLLGTAKSGKRVIHVDGIGALGMARVLDDPKVPPNDFFSPGKLFEVRSRHSNFPESSDDTKLGSRALALKFVDFDEDSPLDLVLLTSPISPFFNVDSISELISAPRGSREAAKKRLLSLPVYLDAHIHGVRHLPDSYYHQHYYAQTVYQFSAQDGKPRLARFRAIPADGSDESGLLTEEQQRDLWNLETPEETDLNKDYLKQEFARRLESGPVCYTLQMQLFEVPDGAPLNHNMFNPSQEWLEEKNPWTDLMTITLDSQLPHGVTEVTRFNVGHLPTDVLSFPKPMTKHDFNVVPYVRMNVYKAASSRRPRHLEALDQEYTINMVTGTDEDSGTDDTISISIIGTKSRTSFHKLDYILKDDFEKGSIGTYTVEDVDVGNILCIKVHAKDPGRDNWKLQYATITTCREGEEEKTYIFPCYQWLTSKRKQITLFTGTSVLPQNEKDPYLKFQRELELQQRQTMYKWRPRGKDKGFENYPGYINAGAVSDDLPRDAQFDGGRSTEMDFKRRIGKSNAFLGFLENNLWGGSPIEEKETLITQLIEKSTTLKYIIDHWDEDDEFGRQVLQGVNPVKITRVKEIPQNFPVTNEMVEESLDEGKSLADEITAGKIYLIAYPELEEYCKIESGQERYLCAPMCLLYVKSGKLIPIAIQLTNDPDTDTPIFTKKDDDSKFSDWLLAKMWVRVADTNHHQLATHLLCTHLVMEPVSVALMRNLSSRHPIYKLLIPHVRFVMAINTLGREVLIPDGTAISVTLAVAEHPNQHVHFMEKIYQGLTFSSLNVPKSFVERGVDDPTLLPDYFYRDDALLMWDAIGQFVGQVLKIYYKTDKDVEGDEEMKAFIDDLQQNGYHEKMGLPEAFINIEVLQSFLVTVMFCCSCQHAAVNFGQFDTFSFTPNAPSCMMQPPPTRKNPGGLDEAEMRKILPPHKISQTICALTNLLSMYSDNELYLGQYPDAHFTDSQALDAIANFQVRLKTISENIRKRNKELPVPYVYLLPERVPNSIAI